MKEYLDTTNWETKLKGKVWTYIGPPLDNVYEEDLKTFFKRNKIWIAIWTSEFDHFLEGNWCRYVCDVIPYSFDNIVSKSTRKQIQRCLKKCEIVLVDLDFIAQNCYDTYLKASIRYENFVPITEKTFSDRYLSLYSKGIYDGWVVKKNNMIIAYSIVVKQNNYAILLVAKFNSEYSNAYPMYGMYYTVADYYLNQNNFNAVLGGNKTLKHKTNIESFREKLGWRKAYSRLNMFVNPIFLILIKFLQFTFYFWKIFLPSKFLINIEGLLTAYKISKSYR